MFGSILGAVGAVSDFASGLINSHNQAKADQHNFNREFDEGVRQFNVQDDYNKNMTQYRVKDAIAAGINPLAALGMSGNYSPTASTAVGGGSSRQIPSFSGMTKALAKMFERENEDKINDEKESRKLGLESMRLENEYRRAQINALQNGNTGEPVTPPDQLYRVALDLSGRPRLVINQDILEADDDNPGYKSAMIAALGQIDKKTGRIPKQARYMIDDWFYKKYGYHIPNLEELYVSPMEVGIVGKGVADETGATKAVKAGAKFVGRAALKLATGI